MLGSRLLIPSVLLIAALAAALPARADEAADYARLTEQRGKALVTIKFVLKMKLGGMGDQESEQEITAVMIEPTGLAMCSNSQMGGLMGMARRFMRGMGDVSITPTDIKVLIGDDTQGLDAELLARDTELDLAWIKIKDAKGKTFEHVDLGKSAKAAVGQRVLSVVRLGKYFDRVSAVTESRISAVTRKPRELYVPAAGMLPNGLPVYSAAGDFVGVSVSQAPDDEESDDMSSLFSMSMSDLSFQAFILPAADVVRATARAKEVGASQSADDDGDKPNKNDEPASKPAAKPAKDE